METNLRKLFSYQRIAENPALAGIIADTCIRWQPEAAALSDDDAALVSAAGAPVCISSGEPADPLEQTILQNPTGGHL